jgi:hypothetical protein
VTAFTVNNVTYKKKTLKLQQCIGLFKRIVLIWEHQSKFIDTKVINVVTLKGNYFNFQDVSKQQNYAYKFSPTSKTIAATK